MERLLEKDFESAMEQDANGTLLREIRESFVQQKAKLQKTMDSGLPAAEFKEVSMMKNACEAAESAVEAIWNSMHKQ